MLPPTGGTVNRSPVLTGGNRGGIVWLTGYGYGQLVWLERTLDSRDALRRVVTAYFTQLPEQFKAHVQAGD